jgi:hypothetical protein
MLRGNLRGHGHAWTGQEKEDTHLGIDGGAICCEKFPTGPGEIEHGILSSKD